MKLKLLAALALLASPLSAQQRERPWLLVAEDMQTIAADQPLLEGTVVLRQRFVPGRLAILGADAVSEDGGEQWAASGDMLFGITIQGREVFCVVESRTNYGALMFSGYSGNTRIMRQSCFADADGDGAFDERHVLASAPGGMPRFGQERLRDPYAMRPAAFERADSLRFDGDAWVELRFRRSGDGDERPPEFELVCRYMSEQREFTRRFATSNNLAQPFSVLGGEIRLHRDEAGAMFAEVLKPMNGDFQSFFSAGT